MSGTYDVAVLGAGHNGLTAAAALAKRGRRVLVLERRTVLGGLAAREEFHPGYRSAGVLQDAARVWPEVIEDLGLVSHGLQRTEVPPRRLALGGGAGMVLGGGVRETSAEIARVSAADAERYAEYAARVDRMRDVVRAFLHEPPVDVLDPASSGALDLLRRGLRVRRLGRRDMLELLRLPPMSVADHLDEWFETGPLKAALALPALAGNFTGPRSPGSNVNLLFDACDTGTGIAGGGPALVDALASCAGALGVEIRREAPVARVVPAAPSGFTVVLGNGEEITARVVAAACHPRRLLLDLLPPGSISQRLVHRIRHYRSRGTTAQVLFAIDGPVRLGEREDFPIEFASTGRDLDHLERAFDAIKYRHVPEEPVLEIHVPSLTDPTLAPPGKSVVAVLVHFVPYELDGGWTDAARDRLGDRVAETLAAHVPAVAASTLARTVLAPVDLEAIHGLPGGNILHGEHALDQLLVRPVAGCAGHRTPIRGLYLCGGGSHPGGGLSCGPGALAARAILVD